MERFLHLFPRTIRQVDYKSSTSLIIIRLLLLTLLLLQATKTEQLPQDHSLKSYAKQGDVNLGAFFSISNYSPFSLCGDGLLFPLAQQYVEALMFAVDEVNRNKNLLPNTTLGLIILDDCAKQSTASAQAVRFLTPRQNVHRKRPGYKTSNERDSRHDGDQRANKVSVSNTTTDTEEISGKGCQGKSNGFQVVGVLSPTRSDTTIAVSYLLGPAEIPLLSFSANSDEMSNAHLHPYFLRLVPPASREVTAILEFIASQGWSYISVVTGRGSYGDAAVAAIRWEAFRLGICVAVHVKTRLGMAESEYNTLVRELLRFPSARAVITFVGFTEMKGLLKAVKECDSIGWHVWIGSDAWANQISLIPDDLRPGVHGSFITILEQPNAPHFEEYFRRLKPLNNTNPWFKEFWQRQFNCSFAAGTCDENADVTKSKDFRFLSLNGLAIDSVYVYAHALTDLMKAECEGITGPDLRNCVTGSRLFAYLNNVSFSGITGPIKLGEERAVYTMSQILPGNSFSLNPVARIDVTVGAQPNSAGSIEKLQTSVTKLNPVDWDGWFSRACPVDIVLGHLKEPFNAMGGGIASHDRQLQNDPSADDSAPDAVNPLSLYLDSSAPDKDLVEFQLKLTKASNRPIKADESPSSNNEKQGYPESTCRLVCKPGEISVVFKSPCCRDCRPCRKNEIVVENGTRCKQCPLFQWPDEVSDLTRCAPIPPDYAKFTDLSVIFEVATSCVGMIVSLIVCGAFVYLRDSKIIKASGRELSCIQLFAIVVGYGTMLVYAAPPSDVSCSVAYFLFCLTLDLLYAALLVKSVRIYRIFNAGGKGTRGLKMTSPLSQVVIVCCIVLGQAVISTCVTGLHRASARLSQPSRSEPYVEIACDMSIPAVSTFLAYNLTLVTLCAVLAFKTRSVPDNFRESRYISMCVTTTLVIWLGFIPTFLTSSRESLKTLVLSLALLLNHSVALVFLFLSKLYAAIYRSHAPIILLPVMSHSGQVSVGMVEGAVNSSTGSGVTNGVAKAHARIGASRSGSSLVEQDVSEIAKTVTVGTSPTKIGELPIPPGGVHVRKTGRFTVVTHTGKFVHETSARSTTYV